jgi:hypothetical protein
MQGMSALLNNYRAPTTRFYKTVLLDNDATTGAVTTQLEPIANRSKAGDLCVIYFSCHGGWVPGLGRNDHGFTDYLCCYDGPLWDYNLRKIWQKFKANTRIVMISDSCHSGTNDALMSRLYLNSEYRLNNNLSALSSPDLHEEIKAMLIHYGACKDEELS